MKYFNTRKLVFMAVCIALAVTFSQFKLFSLPFGGSATPFSMFFIVLAAYWFGMPAGVAAGVTMGLLKLFLDPYVIHPIQYILDYPAAYAMLGIAGLFRKMPYGLQIGYLVGVAGRYLMAVLSGLIFFGSFTDGGDYMFAASLAVSLSYNISYIWPEVLVTLAIICLPAVDKAIKVVGKGADGTVRA